MRDQNIKLFSAVLIGMIPSGQRATIEALLADECANNAAEQHAIARGAAPMKAASKQVVSKGRLQLKRLDE